VKAFSLFQEQIQRNWWVCNLYFWPRHFYGGESWVQNWTNFMNRFFGLMPFLMKTSLGEMPWYYDHMLNLFIELIIHPFHLLTFDLLSTF